jgi:hypothetical protein
MPNFLHQVEVVVPAGVTVETLGEVNDAGGGKLLLQANSTTSLAAAKAQVGALGTAVTAAAA